MSGLCSNIEENQCFFKGEKKASGLSSNQKEQYADHIGCGPYRPISAIALNSLLSRSTVLVLTVSQLVISDQVPTVS